MIDADPEFGFVAGMPTKPKRRGPRESLHDRVRQLMAEGYTMAQIAKRISPKLSARTVEAWAQSLSLPRAWVCELLLEKLS